MHDFLFAPDVDSVSQAVAATWRELPPRTRRLLVAATVFWLAALVLLFGGTPLIQQWIDQTVRAAARGEPSLLPLIATRIQRIAPEIYIEKFFVLFLRIRAIAFLLLTGTLIWLYRRHFPSIWRALKVILLPGMILGLAVSIRIFGAWAGVLVAGYIFWKSGRKAWLLIATYAGIAILAMYLTWPYLWPNPLGHFFETVTIMANHPWPGQVLFDGVTYRANGLPAYYVPLLLAIQLTEPVWLLFLAGLIATLYGIGKKRGENVERLHASSLLAFTLAWFVVPLVTFVIVRPTLYDNFRQCFFIVPPIFFMAGLVFDLFRKPILQGALVALVILPGLIASVRLHPYEYVYYNQFIGGAQAAVGRFELDYWATSYREAAREVDRIAPPNANVWVDGPAHLFHGRKDFHIYSAQEADRADHYDVVVTLVRYNWEKTSFPEAKIVYRVSRAGVVFAIIRTP